MKILGFCGSPRAGSTTDQLVQAVLRMLARNAAEGFSQCVHHKLARVRTTGDVVEVDLTALQGLQALGLLDCFHLKLPPGLKASIADWFAVLEERLDAAGHGLLRLQRQPGSWRGTLTCTAAAETSWRVDDSNHPSRSP